jgi:GNAT superfamily N-acetyltransferase
MAEEGDMVPVRLGRGCRCFVALRDEEVVGYGWLSTGPEWIGELGLEIRPTAGEAYVWNCVTLMPHRRQGIFRTLLVFITAQARKEGLVRLWIGSVEDVGEQAVAGAGFVPVLNFAIVPLRWLRWLTVRPLEGAAPELVAAAMRALTVSGRMHRARSRRH